MTKLNWERKAKPTRGWYDPFRARFAGLCPGCKAKYPAGTMIKRRDGVGYYHAQGCPQEAPTD